MARVFYGPTFSAHLCKYQETSLPGCMGRSFVRNHQTVFQVAVLSHIFSTKGTDFLLSHRLISTCCCPLQTSAILSVCRFLVASNAGHPSMACSLTSGCSLLGSLFQSAAHLECQLSFLLLALIACGMLCVVSFVCQRLPKSVAGGILLASSVPA